MDPTCSGRLVAIVVIRFPKKYGDIHGRVHSQSRHHVLTRVFQNYTNLHYYNTPDPGLSWDHRLPVRFHQILALPSPPYMFEDE
jgi:hypothetical protein